MRKPVFFAYAKTKMQTSCSVIVQLISAFVFYDIDSTIPLLSKSEVSSHWSSSVTVRTAWFVSDLVEIPDDRLCRDAAQMKLN